MTACRKAVRKPTADQQILFFEFSRDLSGSQQRESSTALDRRKQTSYSSTIVRVHRARSLEELEQLDVSSEEARMETIGPDHATLRSERRQHTLSISTYTHRGIE